VVSTDDTTSHAKPAPQPVGVLQSRAHVRVPEGAFVRAQKSPAAHRSRPTLSIVLMSRTHVMPSVSAPVVGMHADTEPMSEPFTSVQRSPAAVHVGALTSQHVLDAFAACAVAPLPEQVALRAGTSQARVTPLAPRVTRHV